MILSDIQRKERQNKVNEDENVQTVEHVVDGLNLKRREISDVSLYIFMKLFSYGNNLGKNVIFPVLAQARPIFR